MLVGDTSGHLGQSLYLREIHGREDGPPPPVDLAAERRNGDFVRAVIQDGLISACHDLSDGGLIVALVEMALAGDRGAELVLPVGVDPIGFLFGEDQARYLVTAADAGPLLDRAAAVGIPARLLGTTGGTTISLNRGNACSLAHIRAVHEGWLPTLMAAEG